MGSILGRSCRTYYLCTGPTVAEFFVGGVLGLKAAGFLFGGTAEAGLASRALVGASMIVGVMVTGLIFVTGSAAMAWAAAQIAAVLRRRIVQEHA